MSADARTILEWTYEPEGYFEEPCVLSHDRGKIELGSGSARGEFDGSCYSEGRSFRDETHEFLTGMFWAQQVKVHKPFRLSLANMFREHADGRRDVTIFPESAHFAMKVGRADIVVKDADGNIVRDSKAERLQDQEEFRSAIQTLLPTDRVLRRMLQSFNNALNDNENFLIHLYEMRDALAAEFGGEGSACNAVKVSKAEWSDFGRMANEDPLLEGRHRGKRHKLRRATQDEFEHATKFCQKLVEGYVSHQIAQHI